MMKITNLKIKSHFYKKNKYSSFYLKRQHHTFRLLDKTSSDHLIFQLERYDEDFHNNTMLCA